MQTQADPAPRSIASYTLLHHGRPVRTVPVAGLTPEERGKVRRRLSRTVDRLDSQYGAICAHVRIDWAESLPETSPVSAQ